MRGYVGLRTRSLALLLALMMVTASAPLAAVAETDPPLDAAEATSKPPGPDVGTAELTSATSSTYVAAPSEVAALMQGVSALGGTVSASSATLGLDGPTSPRWGSTVNLTVSYSGSDYFSHGFESWPGPWATFGTTTWAPTTYRQALGSYSAYCAGSAIAAPGPYPYNMDGWMVAGPIDASSIASASLVFDAWLHSEYTFDTLYAGVSVNGTDFSGASWAGPFGEDGWQTITVSGYDFTADDEVWIGFRFTSDGSVQYEGAYVDNVRLIGGSSGPGQNVTLQRRPIAESTWTNVGSTFVQPGGSATIPVVADARYAFRAAVGSPGSETYSEELLVEPTPYLTIRAPSSVSKDKGFTVYGYLEPRRTSGAKDVIIKCYLGTRLVKSVRATNYNYTSSAGKPMTKYSATVSLPTKGKWTLKASVGASEKHVAQTTGGATVYVNRTTLSANRSRTHASYYRPVKLTSTLKNRAGKALAGRTVKLQKQTSSDSWKTVKKLKTNKYGKVAASVKPKSHTTYRFKFDGDSNNLGSTSRVRYVISTYTVWTGYANTSTGYWNWFRSLPAGKYRVRVYSARGFGNAKIRKLNSSWTKSLGRVPASSWKTFTLSLSRSGYYSPVVEKNKYYNNYVRYVIW